MQLSRVDSGSVQYSQQALEQQLPSGGDFNYRLDCKKPIDRYAFAQASRYEEELKASRVVTYRGLKKASGRAKRKLMGAPHA